MKTHILKYSKASYVNNEQSELVSDSHYKEIFSQL